MNKENTVPALDLDQDKPNEQTIEEIVASLGDTVALSEPYERYYSNLSRHR